MLNIRSVGKMMISFLWCVVKIKRISHNLYLGKFLYFPSQVHIRVASPPIRYPCYMGINIPTKEELIANKPEFEDIAGYIGQY